MLLGMRLPCLLLLPLLQRGHGDAEYQGLEDEGLYLYLDEDELPEVLGGPAHCQDTYQDWISLYCWVPFHATLMSIPEGSRCRWDQISSPYSELSGCTQLVAQLLPCPWAGDVLNAFFLQVHSEYFSNCTGTELPVPGRLSPRVAVVAATGLGCLVPLAAALTLCRAQKRGSNPCVPLPHDHKELATDLFPPSTGNS